MPSIRWSVAKYLAELERRGASKHTLRAYGSDLEQFAAYFEPPDTTPPALEDLDLPLLREWLSGLYDGGLETVSVRRKLAAYADRLQSPVVQARQPLAQQRQVQVLQRWRRRIRRLEVRRELLQIRPVRAQRMLRSAAPL